MKFLKSLVNRNIQHAKARKQELVEGDIYSSRYWEGYISALESIVHVLPDDEVEDGKEKI